MLNKNTIHATIEEAEYIKTNHNGEYLNVDITPTGPYSCEITGPTVATRTINYILNTVGPNKLDS